MIQINCLNLCEILPYLKKRRSTFQIIEDSMKLASFQKCERIYIGSYFCGKYFIQQSDTMLLELLNLCKEENMKVTLVVPTFSEGDLEAGKRRIHQIICHGSDRIDEFTVNDFGMLRYLKGRYELPIHLGRLFMKDYRDPRYVEYFQTLWRPKMFTNYLVQKLQDEDFVGVEFDLTHQNMDFSKIPKDIVTCLHVPYCYQTVGRICEYSSITKEIENKFRANDVCDQGCAENMINYSVSDGEVEYIHFGRTVYFRHPGYRLDGLKDYRLIYFPIHLSEEPTMKSEVYCESTSSV